MISLREREREISSWGANTIALLSVR